MAKFAKECVNISSGKVRLCMPIRDTLTISDHPCSWIIIWHASTISGERLVTWIEMPLFLLTADGIAFMISLVTTPVPHALSWIMEPGTIFGQILRR